MFGRLHKDISRLARCAAIAVMGFGATASFGAEYAGPTPVPLKNDWKNAASGASRAMVRMAADIVYLSGAVHSGSSALVMQLPVRFRPTVETYVPVNLCDGRKGRLYIQPDGDARVEPYDADAECMTSLDGASFVKADDGLTTLTLLNNWFGAGYGTGTPSVVKRAGVVYFKGSIYNIDGYDAQPFTLPLGFRPPKTVHVSVDMCDSAHGHLTITPNGTVTIVPEDGDTVAAACFVSLDGASFLTGAMPTQVVTLEPLWGPPGPASAPAVGSAYGVVMLKGAITSVGGAAVPFVLPPAYRPVTNVYVPVTLCDARHGRLKINVFGTVTLSADDMAAAQCMTSLDGVKFVQ